MSACSTTLDQRSTTLDRGLRPTLLEQRSTTLDIVPAFPMRAGCFYFPLVVIRVSGRLLSSLAERAHSSARSAPILGPFSRDRIVRQYVVSASSHLPTPLKLDCPVRDARLHQQGPHSAAAKATIANMRSTWVMCCLTYPGRFICDLVVGLGWTEHASHVGRAHAICLNP